MPIPKIFRIFQRNADAKSSASIELPARNGQASVEPEIQTAGKETAPTALGEDWPPNLHSHETDWFVVPETAPTHDAERSAM